MGPICPVCDTELDASRTAIVQRHEGELYFFKSPQCLRIFKAEPVRFLGGEKLTCPAAYDGVDG
jgi:YHS domain-containing protein